MGISYIVTAKINLLANTEPSGNPSLARETLNATSIAIPLSFKTEEVELLATGGTFTQIMGPEAVEVEMSLFGWSANFISSIIEKTDDNVIFPKRVGLMATGVLVDAQSGAKENVIVIVYGKFTQLDLFKMEAGNAQESDFTFIATHVSWKYRNQTHEYNVSGL
jgi:hypothetical protein